MVPLSERSKIAQSIKLHGRLGHLRKCCLAPICYFLYIVNRNHSVYRYYKFSVDSSSIIGSRDDS